MNQKISPVVAVVIIVVVIGIAAFAWLKFTGSPAGSMEGKNPPPMPPDVAAEFAKRGAAMSGPKTGGGPSGATPLLPGAPAGGTR